MSIYAFIPNEGTGAANGTVSVVDTTTLSVAATITVGKEPYGAVATPDGSKAYISNSLDGTVSVINTSAVLTTISVGTTPLGLAITPDGSKVYACNNGGGTVSAISTVTNTVIATITVGTNPTSVAVSPDGTTLYVANAASNSISIINIATNTVTATITTGVGTNPDNVAVSPDGTRLYVANGASGTVSIINTATLTAIAGSPVTVGSNVASLAVTPDGTKVFVANEGSSSISIINTSTLAVTNSTSGIGSAPYGVAITPDGTQAYITNAVTSGNVSVISTTSPYGAVGGSPITLGQNPIGYGKFIAPTAQPIIPPGTPPTLFAVTPQGRLTLSSTSPVMMADATAQATIYYLPYIGAALPIYNGAQFVNYLMGSSGIALALDSNSGHTGYQASGSLFDIFAFINSGVLTLGTGPAWTNSTTRSAAITQVNGLWVNNAAITLRFGNASGNTVSVPAYQATYLGTMYATSNGQTGMQFMPTAAAGGTNNVLGLYNAYNRVTTRSICRDNTSTWSYTSATIRPANNSTSNRISFVDGLGQSFIEGIYENNAAVNPTPTTYAQIGIGLDVTNAFSSGCAVGGSASGNNLNIITHYYSVPQMGFHFLQAVENNAPGTGTASFGDLSGAQDDGLFLNMEM